MPKTAVHKNRDTLSGKNDVRPPYETRVMSKSPPAHAGTHNFGQVVIEPAHLTVRIVDATGATLFTHRVGPE